MSNENNKIQVDIENLFKQNVNDLSAIKELYRKLKEVEEKISQIKYIDSTLAYKLKKEYEKLKRIILDENAQATLSNEIETVKTKLTNDIKLINSQLDNKTSKEETENLQVKLNNDIESINSQLDTNTSKITNLGYLNILDYGADNTGVTDCSSAINKALNDINENVKTIKFPQGYYTTSKITLPNKEIYIEGDNATIRSIDNDIIFEQNNHIFTSISGFIFKNCKVGIKLNMEDSKTMFNDFSIFNNRFLSIKSDNITSDGDYGIILIGAREGNINNCYFDNCNGIFRSHTVNTIIRDCNFKNGNIGVYDCGDNTAYSCGLDLESCQMIGVAKGVYICETDNFIINDCMIDYCDEPVIIESQDNGKITNSYISSRTMNPAIRLTANTDNVLNNGIRICKNNILTHYQNANVGGDCIEINYLKDGLIEGNYIHFYSRYGINILGNLLQTIFTNNVIAPRTPNAIASVGSSTDFGGSITNKFINNYFNIKAFDKIRNYSYSNNTNFRTKSTGRVTIESGQTSKTIQHNLAHSNIIFSLCPNKNIGVFGKIVGNDFIITLSQALEEDVEICYKLEHIYNDIV